MLFTNPTQINIRATPSVVISPSNDVGDLPKNSVITALEVRATDNNSVWVRFIPDPMWVTQTLPAYWVALVHDGQGPLLQWVSPPSVPPLPTLKLQATHQPTNLYYWNQTNGAGYPLMKLPPVGQRCQFAEGAQLIVNPTKVNADGTVDYYEVYNAHLANPTFPVPSGYTGWFVSEQDVIEVAP